MQSTLLLLWALLVPILSLTGHRKVVRVLNLLDSAPVSYQKVWDWQQRLMNYHVNCQSNPVDNIVGTLILLEHENTYTLGTGTREGSGPFLPTSSELPYETFNVERAGEATYHGPGQLVVYPILDLNYFEKDINLYLRNLEQVTINSLHSIGIEGATRVDGHTGVWVSGKNWVANKKVAALGIKLRRWVTMHGMSINVCPDMRYFQNIVPCGIRDKEVCSIANFDLPSQISVKDFSQSVLTEFSNIFDIDLEQSLVIRVSNANVVEADVVEYMLSHD